MNFERPDREKRDRQNDVKCLMTGTCDVDRKGARGGSPVCDLDGDLIHDPAIGHGDERSTGLAKQRDFSDLGLRAAQEDDKGGKSEKKKDGIKDRPCAKKAFFPVQDLVLGRVADQTEGLLDLGHDRIASIDALGAMDAFHLEAITDIDPGGAGRDASATVDAISESFGGRFFAGTLASGFAALGIVANDQRSTIEENRLKTAIGTGDETSLLSKKGEVEEDKGRRDEHDEEGRGMKRRRLMDPEP